MMFTVRSGEPNYFKCHCQRCGGHIEFPSNGAGVTIDCPHCGKKTVLGVAIGGAKLKKSNKVLWIALGLMAVIAGGAVVFIWPQKPKARAVADPVKVVDPVKTVAAPFVPVTITNQPVSQTTSQPAPAANTISDFDLTKISLQKVPGSSLVYAVGTAKNTVARQRFGVKIELNELDENDKNLGVISDYVSVVDPQKAWQFKAVLTSPHVAKVTVAGIKEQQ
ncbi:MAG TPA: FxLYD domain-containing protein [Verrucomicrobiae bacterium]|nr:FxLYD domain-containing protein [Verrucomicrobiae bacterium]